MKAILKFSTKIKILNDSVENFNEEEGQGQVSYAIFSTRMKKIIKSVE